MTSNNKKIPLATSSAGVGYMLLLLCLMRSAIYNYRRNKHSSWCGVPFTNLLQLLAVDTGRQCSYGRHIKSETILHMRICDVRLI